MSVVSKPTEQDSGKEILKDDQEMIDQDRQQKILDQIRKVLKDYFNLFPNRTEEECDQQSEEMLKFILDSYQKNYFNLESTLELIVKDFEKNKLMKEMIINITQKIINPNKKVIYNSSQVEKEVKSDQGQVKEEPEPEPDIETKRRLQYQEMIKPVAEKFNNDTQTAEEFIPQMILQYKKNLFDKKKTVDEYFEPYPVDVKTQMNPMIEKLLDNIDKYLCLFVVPEPPTQEKSEPQVSPAPKTEVDQKESVENTAKDILAQMVSAAAKVFDGNEEVSRNYVISTIQLYRELNFKKFALSKSVEGRFKEAGNLSLDNQKKIIDLTNLLMEQIDYFNFLTNIETTFKKPTTDDGYISDDDEEKPLIRNQDYWVKYPIKAVFWESDITKKNQERQKIRVGARGKTVKPPPDYERDVTIFTRRWSNTTTKKTKYRPPETKLTKIVNEFKNQLKRFNYQAGINDWSPAENLRQISKKIYKANISGFMPIALTMETLVRNLLKIEDLMGPLMDKINVPEDIQVVERENISSFEEFNEYLDHLQDYLNWYEKNLAETTDEKIGNDLDQFQAWQKLDQLCQIIKRFALGHLICHPIGKNKKSDYMFVMAPYNYCFNCKIFRLEDELEQEAFYDPLKCSKCQNEIYHLNNALYFKFDPKEKMIPVLTRMKTSTISDHHLPTIKDYQEHWTIQLASVIRAILDQLDQEPEHVFPTNLKLEDLYPLESSQSSLQKKFVDDSSSSSSSSSSSGSYDQVPTPSTISQTTAIVTSCGSKSDDEECNGMYELFDDPHQKIDQQYTYGLL